MPYREVNQAVRDAFYNLLNGNLIVGGNPVPIYDQFADDNAGDIFVLLSTQYSDSQNDYQKFRTGAVILLDIQQRQRRGMRKSLVDEISNQIFGLVKPTVSTTGLVPEPPFQFLNVYRESDTYQTFHDNVNKVVRRIDRWRLDVVQDEFL